jgi:hypothetical protein
MLLTDLDPANRAELEHRLVTFDRAWRVGSLRAEIDHLPAETPWCWAAVVEMVKIDLERNWRMGNRPTLSDYLRTVPELGSAADLPASLIAVECLLHKEFAAATDFAEFYRCYPAQAQELRKILDSEPEIRTSDENTQRTQPRIHARLPGEHGQPVLPGSFGRYRIIRLLGRGGMGAVYLAHDPQLQRDVALKIPAPELITDARGIDLLLQEARAAAGLRHPNICPVYDAGVIEGTPFITSLFIEGEPLSVLAKRKPPIPQSEVANLVATVARALDHAHAQGIIHRDLKPSNIMLDRSGQPIVTDFGLARRIAVDRPTLATMSGLAGSPAYMAPEQVTETKAGPASDIFSLGVVLYELLAGRVPFQGTPEDVLHKLVHRKCPPPSRFRPDLDHRLEAICLKAMAKNPHARYARMGDFADALDAYRMPLSRRWRVALVAVAVLLTVGVVVGIAAVMWNRKPGAGPTQPTPSGDGVRDQVGPKTQAFRPAFERVADYNQELFKPPSFIGKKPTTPQEWIEALDDADESNRYLAVLEVARSNNKDAIPRLARRMALPPGIFPEKYEHWAVRRECAAAIGYLGKGNTFAEDALAARIADPHWQLAREITIQKDRWRNPFQGETLRDPEHGGKGAALDALEKIAPTCVRPALEKAVERAEKLERAKDPAEAQRGVAMRKWATAELEKRKK